MYYWLCSFYEKREKVAKTTSNKIYLDVAWAGKKKGFLMGFPSSKFDSAYVVYGTAFVYTELYMKVTDRKKIVWITI